MFIQSPTASNAHADSGSQDIQALAVVAHHESLRTHAFRDYVETLVARGLLREGVPADEATDVLLTLTGSEVFLTFTETRGWPVDRYVTWTADALASLLVKGT